MFLNVILISYFLKNFSYELIIDIKKKRKNIARLHVSSLFRKMWSSSAYGLSFYPYILYVLLPFSQSFLCFQEKQLPRASISQKPVSPLFQSFFLTYWRYVYESIRR